MDHAAVNYRQLLKSIPEGYSEYKYNNNRYGLIKSTFNGGKSCKVYAKELGGNKFISFNYYQTKNNDLMIPCEIPRKAVNDFIKGIEVLQNKSLK